MVIVGLLQRDISIRTSALNIFRSSTEPARMCTNVVDPSLCFKFLITNEIIWEIGKSNVKMELKSINHCEQVKGKMLLSCQSEKYGNNSYINEESIVFRGQM